MAEMNMGAGQWSIDDAGEDYADWRGTTWADEHVAIRHPSLNQVLNLDPHRWWIVGIEFTSHDGDADRVIVRAVDRSLTSPGEYSELVELAQQAGGLPVVEFVLVDLSAGQFVSRAFTEFHVQLLARDLHGIPTRVLEQRQHHTD
jgi:hypothetical protein